MTRGRGIYDDEVADGDDTKAVDGDDAKAANKEDDAIAAETPDVEKGSSEPTA